MASGKPPGHECVTKGNRPVKDGTNCLQPAPRPGPLGQNWGSDLLSGVSSARAAAGKWLDETGAWLGDKGSHIAGHSKSLLLTLLDLLPLKQASPFSTALLKHYVERSGEPYKLENFPSEWQDWIVKATRGRFGKHTNLNPYNSGLYDLRNSLGHFDVEVKAGPGTKKTYVISDVYQFGHTENDKQQRGRHGFPIGNPSDWVLDAARKLLPDVEYRNPGGFKEKWEIRKSGNETILFIPQQYLEQQGKPFPVTGTFER
jgi:hypothetical protein